MFEVFGKPNCKYCVKAKELLISVNADYTYTDLTEDNIALKMIKLQGHTTVPVISLNGVFIGGYAELDELLQVTPL